MLLTVKDLRQDWPRIIFRVRSVDAFKAASSDFGGYQAVLERFVQYFETLKPADRFKLLQKMAESSVIPSDIGHTGELPLPPRGDGPQPKSPRRGK